MTREELKDLRLRWFAAQDYYEAARRAYAAQEIPRTADEVSARHALWDNAEDRRREADEARIKYERAAVAWERQNGSGSSVD